LVGFAGDATPFLNGNLGAFQTDLHHAAIESILGSDQVLGSGILGQNAEDLTNYTVLGSGAYAN
jgi:hypothetical protein